MKLNVNCTNKHNATLLSQLYASTIRSIFEYSSVCLVSAANVHLEKLQVIQNKALRIILKVPAYIPIARMNDCGNEKYVKEHLCTIARERILKLTLSSSSVQKTVEKFRSLKQTSFNASPLDVIHL